MESKELNVVSSSHCQKLPTQCSSLEPVGRTGKERRQRVRVRVKISTPRSQKPLSWGKTGRRQKVRSGR